MIEVTSVDVGAEIFRRRMEELLLPKMKESLEIGHEMGFSDAELCQIIGGCQIAAGVEKLLAIGWTGDRIVELVQRYLTIYSEREKDREGFDRQFQEKFLQGKQ